MYPSLLLLCIIPQRFARDQNGVERGCFLCHLWCVACRLAWTVPHWLSGAAYEKYPLCVCGSGGERGVQIWLQLEFCDFCVSILCLLLTLLHLIVESCQRSRRHAACSKQHVACGMPIGGKPHRHLRLFWVVLFSHSAQFMTIYA